MATQEQLLTKLERMLNQGKEKDQLIYKILIQQEQQNQEFGQILSQMEPMIGRIVTKIAESVDALLEQLESVDGVAENRKKKVLDAAAEMQKLGLAEGFHAVEAASRARLAAAMTNAPDKRGTPANKRKKKKRKRKKNRTKKKSN